MDDTYHTSGNCPAATGQNTWSNFWIYFGSDNAGELDRSGHCCTGAGAVIIRSPPMPCSQGEICDNLPSIENLVPSTSITTAGTLPPTNYDSVYMVNVERRHFSCSYDDPPATNS